MQAFVNRLWYGRQLGGYGLLAILLLPLSALFYLLSSVRRWRFKWGIKQACPIDVPVIVVGNITVGGSGKTPTVIYLIELLRRQGYTPGVISRGYGVKFEGTKWVLPELGAKQVGDEPAMIVGRTQVPMVIGKDRVAAANALLSDNKVDVIISDDGLQHYSLHRDIELLVLDGERRLGNGFLLPAGPLREGAWRQQSVDHVIVNGQTANDNEYAMQLLPGELVSLTAPSAVFEGYSDSVAIAGIGNPARFFNTLNEMGISPLITHAFEDHHDYSAADILAIANGHHVLMTEKDAVKCREFAKENWWYLPVDAKLPAKFEQQLLAQLTALKQGNTNGV
ncbi:tetraacyldisaccharide 4'-kinase [Shewanella colwelliana]|uniref:tetraacyldisaccharide 4'-kinase n=1 Tax=Shewanella colwelliana TaxID=23 RepID=UPI001BB8FCC2|nr:tetraacyldisaccharide 4'-kinase [Shewanella colwelliana]GIU20823.1 tetraacyldisaccharide 4'-kinase [Shewanella colwelliana]